MTFYKSELKRIKQICYSNDKHLKTVRDLKHYIDKNYHRSDLDLDVLSQSIFVSKYHLLRLFKRYYGTTPRQYLIDKRIEQSKEQLKHNLSVTETCFAVGFESIGSFSTLFKSKTNQSPGEYQKEQLSRNKLHS